MSTKTKPAAESAEEFARRFEELVARCDHDTRYSSRHKDKINHPAFREIAAMGTRAIPLLLASIEREPSWWTLALREIAGPGVGPTIPPESYGKLDDIVAAWIAWGRDQGYRWDRGV